MDVIITLNLKALVFRGALLIVELCAWQEIFIVSFIIKIGHILPNVLQYWESCLRCWVYFFDLLKFQIVLDF